MRCIGGRWWKIDTTITILFHFLRFRWTSWKNYQRREYYHTISICQIDLIALIQLIIVTISSDHQDIAGIVYTIYESIGKSVVVPHCGSKTINVRLTVSPDAKSKSGDSTHSVKKSSKRERLKSRRLFKCDNNDEEGSGSGCCDTNQETMRTPQQPDESLHQTSVVGQSTPIVAEFEKSDVIVSEKHKTEETNRMSKDTVDRRLETCCVNETKHHRQTKTTQQHNENIYESAPISNEKTGQTSKTKCDKVMLNNNNSCCQDCRVTNQLCQLDDVPISKPCSRKIGRKSRSRKQKNAPDLYPATRIRSLSVGNENRFRNSNGGDASSGASGKGRNDEYLNNLRRNDLIDIIRESMEKSRLCFQSNG